MATSSIISRASDCGCADVRMCELESRLRVMVYTKVERINPRDPNGHLYADRGLINDPMCPWPEVLCPDSDSLCHS